MKRFPWLFIFLSSMFLFNMYDTTGKKPAAKINFLVGQIYIIPANSHEAIPAKFNASLYPGDRVETKSESRCEIKYENGNIIRLDQNSLYKIVSIDPARKASQSELSLGRLWANVVKLFGGGQSFAVKTPTAVAAVRGTVYAIDVDSASATFKVFEGSVGVSPITEDSTVTDSVFVLSEGELFLLVNNFEDYLKQQEEAYQQFLKEQEEAFERFQQEDQAAFREFLMRDASDFQQFKQYHVLKEKFDLEQEQKDEWIRWNLERDEQLRLERER